MAPVARRRRRAAGASGIAPARAATALVDRADAASRLATRIAVGELTGGRRLLSDDRRRARGDRGRRRRAASTPSGITTRALRARAARAGDRQARDRSRAARAARADQPALPVQRADDDRLPDSDGAAARARDAAAAHGAAARVLRSEGEFTTLGRELELSKPTSTSSARDSTSGCASRSTCRELRRHPGAAAGAAADRRERRQARHRAPARSAATSRSGAPDRTRRTRDAGPDRAGHGRRRDGRRAAARARRRRRPAQRRAAARLPVRLRRVAVHRQPHAGSGTTVEITPAGSTSRWPIRRVATRSGSVSARLRVVVADDERPARSFLAALLRSFEDVVRRRRSGVRQGGGRGSSSGSSPTWRCSTGRCRSSTASASCGC